MKQLQFPPRVGSYLCRVSLSLQTPLTQRAMASAQTSVQVGRIRVLKEGSHQPGMGPVVYWMFRDQRVRDNWALIHAVHQANKANVPVAVVFNLFHQFKGAKSRHLGFMLRGLRQLSHQMQHNFQIPFFLFRVTSHFLKPPSNDS